MSYLIILVMFSFSRKFAMKVVEEINNLIFKLLLFNTDFSLQISNKHLKMKKPFIKMSLGEACPKFVSFRSWLHFFLH